MKAVRNRESQLIDAIECLIRAIDGCVFDTTTTTSAEAYSNLINAIRSAGVEIQSGEVMERVIHTDMSDIVPHFGAGFGY